MRDLEKLLSLCHCAVLRKASRRISHTYDTALAPSGLKTTQFSLLAAISQTEDAPLTMKELAEAMVMDRSTLGHNLRPLERDGFVEYPSGEDRRPQPGDRPDRKGRKKLTEAAALVAANAGGVRGYRRRRESRPSAQVSHRPYGHRISTNP